MSQGNASSEEWGMYGVGRYSLTQAEVEAFRRDGAVHVAGALDPHLVESMAGAIDRMVERPTPFGSLLSAPQHGLHTDLFLWMADRDARRYALESRVSHLARQAMGSERVSLLNDQLFMKAAGCALPTPWHRDNTAQHADGTQVCGVWAVFDEASPEGSALQFIRGSQKWPMPDAALHREELERLKARLHAFDREKSSLADALEAAFVLVNSRHQRAAAHAPLPNGDVGLDNITPNLSHFDVLAPSVQPGDVLIFDYRVVHGAGGNPGQRPRRALCTRWAGDDVVYRPALGTIPVPWDHLPSPGDALGGPMYPRIWPDQTQPAALQPPSAGPIIDSLKQLSAATP